MKQPPPLYSPKDHEKALAYCVTLGAFGVHYYYVGRHIMGTLLCFFSVTTCAALGWIGTLWILDQRYIEGFLSYISLMVIVAIWPLWDFLALQRGVFKDSDGLPLVPSEKKQSHLP